MKILIIANMRSGSTTFLKWLGMELGYKTINELHNPIFPIEFDLDSDNFIVKEMYHHIKDIPNYTSKFDRVITLTRNDTFDSAISLLYCDEKSNYDYHSKYKINDNWISDRIYEIHRIEKEFIKQNKDIVSINAFHITYEGIFKTKDELTKLCEYLNLDINNLKASELLNNNNRYRNNNKML
jgi:hypothetical protein